MSGRRGKWEEVEWGCEVATIHGCIFVVGCLVLSIHFSVESQSYISSCLPKKSVTILPLTGQYIRQFSSNEVDENFCVGLMKYLINTSIQTKY